jgi:hypothetical protein
MKKSQEKTSVRAKPLSMAEVVSEKDGEESQSCTHDKVSYARNVA